MREIEYPKITVGIDPDADKHGVAIYSNGKLINICQWSLVEIMQYLDHIDGATKSTTFSIENVMANQFVYARNRQSSKSAESKIAMLIGRCQQAQVELQRWLDFYEIPYVLHNPQKGNWADNKAQFEVVTGWKERSNADTRAAAFFGYLVASKDL